MKRSVITGLTILTASVGIGVLVSGCWANRSSAGRYAIDADQSTAAPVTPVSAPQPVEGKAFAAESVDGMRPLGRQAIEPPIDDRDLGKGGDREPLGAPLPEWRVEAYSRTYENPIVSLAQRGGDASTFGIDVDSASLDLVQRYLKEGSRPPAESVRIEEMINGFRYDYAGPDEAGAPFAVHSAVAPCPWHDGHRLLRVALQGRAVDPATRPSLKLVFLIDTSGSMSGADRLPLVQKTLSTLLKRLRADDEVAIVTYAGRAGIALEPTSVEQLPRIERVIKGLDAGGSTAGAAGIRTAYDLARRMRTPGCQTRVVLCTDGDFNVGVTDPEQLKQLIAVEAKSGVYLNVFGYGMGNFQDRTAEALADRGNGVYAYIADQRAIERTVVEGLTSQLVTIAKDAKIQVFFNPAAVSAWRLLGYENRQLKREDFNNDRVDGGELGAGHQVTALYEFLPAGAADANPFIAGRPEAQRGDPSRLAQIRLRWQPPGGGPSTLHEQWIGSAVGEMDADFRFAAGVAGMGLLLRGSAYAGECSWDLVSHLTRGASSAGDPDRQGLVQLIAKQVSAQRSAR